MPWVALNIDVSERKSELAQAIVYDHGAAGLELRDGANLVMPSVRAPAPGQAIIVAYFAQAAAAKAAERDLRRRIPSATTAIERVIERDWSIEWRNQVRSVEVGRLWVGPPWQRHTAPRDKVCLFIEPKMAFGTGDHPTTSLCLAAVDDFMATHPGASVLDVGTGTGVLAFAAKKLGAGRVVALDNDEVAVELARECAAENEISGVEISTDTLDDVSGTFDLVVANILANTLIELAPRLAAKVTRRLVLAGVLVPQAADVRAAFVAQGLEPAGSQIHGEWIRIDLVASGEKKVRSKRPRAAKPISRTRARAMKRLKGLGPR